MQEFTRINAIVKCKELIYPQMAFGDFTKRACKACSISINNLNLVSGLIILCGITFNKALSNENNVFIR